MSKRYGYSLEELAWEVEEEVQHIYRAIEKEHLLIMPRY